MPAQVIVARVTVKSALTTLVARRKGAAAVTTRKGGVPQATSQW